MGLVISDSSTLIHLERIGRLELLKSFYARIIITPAVWREVVEQGKGRAGAAQIANARDTGWIEIIFPQKDSLLRLLTRDLGDGEAEVITAAVERHADLVLLDEWEARRIADLCGLKKTGIVGILIRAKQEGKLDSLRAELDRLRDEGRFWIEDKLYHRALAAVGEE